MHVPGDVPHVEIGPPFETDGAAGQLTGVDVHVGGDGNQEPKSQQDSKRFRKIQEESTRFKKTQKESEKSQKITCLRACHRVITSHVQSSVAFVRNL